MSIRKLKKTDYHKNYIELLNQLRPVDKYSYKEFCDIYDEIKKNNKHNIFVIEDNNIIVGTITLIMEPKFIYAGSRLGHIEDLVVDSNYRKSGYGSKLIEYCEKYAEEHKCKKVGLCSRPTASEFYYKKGYDVIGNYFAKYLSLITKIKKNS